MSISSEESGVLYDLRFNKQSLTIISGSAGAGKSSLSIKIICNKDQLIKDGHLIKNIVVFYNTYQPLYDTLLQKFPNIKFIPRPPTNDEFIEVTQPFANSGGSIVLIDDWINQISPDFAEIATVSSRHNNCFTMMLFQSIFPPSKHSRIISLNTKYFHIFPDPRNVQSLGTLARQMLGSNVNFVIEAYKKVTSRPFSFFTIDLSQETPQLLRFRSNVLMENGPMKCYIPNESYSLLQGQRNKRKISSRGGFRQWTNKKRKV